MGLVLGLSIWVMFRIQTPAVEPRAGARTFEVVITSRKVLVEQMPSGENYVYRFLNATDLGTQEMNGKMFEETLARVAGGEQRSAFLRLLNVSSYNKLWWPALGLLGQIIFAGRMWVQWIASERKRMSVVPPLFWYMSLAGGLITATYFVWRQDLVGVIGQTSGIWIYARNIYFVYRAA
jgi:lipid-A-disaccharide synthase-like uncharacterized protein